MLKEDKTILNELAKSNIKQEIISENIQKAVEKIAESNNGINDTLKALNDNMRVNTDKVNVCQTINNSRELRFWKLMTYLVGIIVVILLSLLGIKYA